MIKQKFESSIKIRGINRDVLISALSPNSNDDFTLKSVERLKHVYFNIFTDYDRRLFDNQAATRVVAAVKYRRYST
ncbi:hypothetical protein [Staphylococcus saprophyticus]|uniref:hypothetical protein n=1 Tax=Staphylococcus saprophyticus TaxID=29385 RepID=UPI0011583A08|nr:hypothetical protein [Staphylococcus saprophyticus]